MSTDNQALQAGLSAINAEIAKTRAYLAKLEAIKQAMESAQGDVPSGVGQQTYVGSKAPTGGLKTAILGVLGAKPMSNGQIRAALKAKGYEFSLSGLHTSKTLTALTRARKIKRVGHKAGAAYVLA